MTIASSTVSTSLVQLKRSLRKQLRSALADIPLQDLQQEGHNLLQRFIATLSTRQQQRQDQNQQQLPYTHICLYLPMKDAREINMVPLLRQSLDWGLRCYVPVVLSDSDDMEMVRVESWQDFERFEKIGKFEILEPPRDTLAERENLIDHLTRSQSANVLIMMPGLGFDSSGGRIGRGKGYYDRMLHRIDQVASDSGGTVSVSKVALCFRCQLVEEVPMQSNDVRMDKILTIDGI